VLFWIHVLTMFAAGAAVLLLPILIRR
jgi:hypothetical protein